MLTGEVSERIARARSSSSAVPRTTITNLSALTSASYGNGSRSSIRRFPWSEHGHFRVLPTSGLPAHAAAEGDPAQKLYRPEAGQPDAHPNLQLVLTKPIDWDLIRQQYDQMVKYTTALRLGTAETEAILRRFTRSNVQHPTYRAFAELGKAIKTIFLCQYLHSEALRREVNEGLNVIEQWNSANDFVFFARRGELASNRSEDHEVSMLAARGKSRVKVYRVKATCPQQMRRGALHPTETTLKH